MAYTAALEGRFHLVRRVADVVAALCLVEDAKSASRLELVICAHHWTMISGPEFVAELHRRLPSVPVLVLGNEQELAEDYRVLGDQVVFLRTPVTAKRLVDTVGTILARKYRNVA